MAVVPPFPTRRPTGYDWLDDEPVFDPARHLQLEPPGATTSLAELGYSADEIAPTATPVAFSEPFRVLSDEGAEVLLEVARRLRGHAVRAGDRIQNTVRGGCYRSAWRAAGRLNALIDEVGFGTGAAEAADRLEEAVVDVARAVEEMRAGVTPIEHYE
jgi:hypothetical protein